MKHNKFAKLAVFTAAIAVAIIAPIIAIAGYEPANRPVKTYTGPDSIAFTYPVFNSWINTPNYGDERAFFDAGTQTGGPYQDLLVVAPGQEITLRMYMHNGAACGLNGTNFNGPGVARNARIQVYIPTATSTQLRSFGYIVADNTNPGWVADSVDFNSAVPVNMEFVPGSARLANGAHPQGVVLPDSIVQHDNQFNVNNPSASIGYQNMDGNFPACFNYDAFVTLKVRINGPILEVSKKVTSPGSTNWQENLHVDVNDTTLHPTTSWLVEYKNTGSAMITNGVIRDTLPAGLALVPGSVMHFDGNHPQGISVADNGLFEGGVGVGNIAPGANGFFRFRTTLKPPFTAYQCGTIVIVNIAQAEASGVAPINDDAKLTATKNVNCTKPPTPPTSPTPPPPSPPSSSKPPALTSLPKTGVDTGLMAVIGSSAMTIGAIKYRKSRQALLKAKK